MIFLTVKSEFFNEFSDYLDTNIVNYILFDLKEIGKVISFCIRLNYDLKIDQIEQIKFLINKKVRELEERRKFSRLDIRKQTFIKNFVKQYVFLIYYTKLTKKKCDITITNRNRLKDKIFIGYCRAHETFIFIIRPGGYKKQHKRILPIKFRSI